MIDEHDPPEPPEATDRPRPVSKLAFYGGVIFAASLLWALEAGGLTWAFRRWGRGGDLGPLPVVLMAMNYGLCYAAADALLKRLGLSRSGTTVEGRGRGPAPPTAPEAEAVESYWLGEQGRSLVWVFAVIGLFSLVIALAPGPKKADKVAGLSIATWGLGLALIFGGLRRRPLIRLDADGITAGHPFRRRFVPWDDVASCEIVTSLDPVGSPTLIRPILKDAKGRTLLELNLKPIPEPERDRLLKFIESRLPKTVFDPWDEAL